MENGLLPPQTHRLGEKPESRCRASLLSSGARQCSGWHSLYTRPKGQGCPEPLGLALPGQYMWADGRTMATSQEGQWGLSPLDREAMTN